MTPPGSISRIKILSALLISVILLQSCRMTLISFRNMEWEIKWTFNQAIGSDHLRFEKSGAAGAIF
jgi:hypothetical protein